MSDNAPRIDPADPGSMRETDVELRLIIEVRHRTDEDPLAIVAEGDYTLNPADAAPKHISYGDIEFVGVTRAETNYTLAGRDLASRTPTALDSLPEAPCIFCGKTIKHFHDEGVGWCIGAMVNGEPKQFLYCDQPPCAEAIKHHDEIWRCGCQPDYVENVGEVCADCGRIRSKRVPVR